MWCLESLPRCVVVDIIGLDGGRLDACDSLAVQCDFVVCQEVDDPVAIGTPEQGPEWIGVLIGI